MSWCPEKFTAPCPRRAGAACRGRREMDEIGLARQVLSPMPELLSYWLPLEDARTLVRYLNDQLAELVASQPQRFSALGAVPLQDVDAAILELEYLVKDLRLPGVEIATHVNGVSIGDPRFLPFFAAAETARRRDLRARPASRRPRPAGGAGCAGAGRRVSGRRRARHRVAHHRRHARAPSGIAHRVQPRRRCLRDAAAAHAARVARRYRR